LLIGISDFLILFIIFSFSSHNLKGIRFLLTYIYILLSSRLSNNNF
jgi:hypothetical protein